MNPRMDKKDLLWFSCIAVFILALGSLPNWIARAAETNNLLFRGLFSDQADYSVHVSMMQAGRMGDWAYQMRFTSEPHNPAFLRMFYITLGHISKWIGLAVEPTYHLARWALGFSALYFIYRLCLRFFAVRNRARLAFLFVALGSGLGWLQLMLGAPLEPISPIDFWLIDAYVFFSISLFPSFAFTIMLMAAALDLYLDYLETPSWKKIGFVSLLAIVSQTTNPIAFATVDAAFAGATLFQWRRDGKVNRAHIPGLGLVAVSQIPLLLYNFIILSRDPIWSQYTTQNQTLSPPPSFYFWGFALFWPPAIFGIYRAVKARSPAWSALSAWAVGGFLLAYLPVFIQRRFLLGVTIPLGMLAASGLFETSNFISAKNQNLRMRANAIALAYILLASVSSLYLALGLSLHMQTRPESAFYPQDLEDAFAWLDKNAAPNDFALGDMQTGQLLGQRTRQKAYLGHEMETLYVENKAAIVQAYYRGLAPPDWLSQTPIRWVIYGPYERELAPNFQAQNTLKIVYQNETVSVYEVNSP
jgi:hypothetical protein